MPRKPIEQKKLEAILSELVFTPSVSQKKLKARFWNRRAQLQLTDGAPTLVEVAGLIKDKRLPDWWQEPGFKEWFRNEEEFKERVEYLANLALDTIEEVLTSSVARESSRIAAAKLMMELGSKLPKGTPDVVYTDEKINSMSEEQLMEYIQKSTPKLITVETSDKIEPEAKDESEEK